MSGPLAVEWPDTVAWARGYLPEALTQAEIPGVFVRDEKPSMPTDPALVKPYKQLLLAEFPGALITPVSRYVRLTLEAWVVQSNGLADLPGARALAARAAFLIESAPHLGSPLVHAEVDAGPTRAKDSISQIEYMSLTLLLEVGAL